MRNNELAHHGILGMRWGVRRTKEQLARLAGRTVFDKKSQKKKTQTEDKTKSSSSSSGKKSLKEMSDAELKQKISRLELEKRYRDLNPEQVSTGKRVVNHFLNDMVLPAVDDIGKQLVKSEMTRSVNELLQLSDEYKIHTNNKRK